MDKIENKLEFLTRVADEFEGTLNAASAIERIQILIDDIERASESFQKAPPEDIYWGWRTFPLDIVSYYAVGFVTCLEWHVRSRITDLFTYAPVSITDKDLEKDASAKVLVRLIAAKASIPQFLAATRNYSTVDADLDNLSRVFKFLDIKPDPREIVHKIPSPEPLISIEPLDSISGIDRLGALYEARNMLVHEINRAHIGHPVSHDPWTCETALAYGKFVLQVVQEIEKVITAQAPDAFPNKLLPDGSVVSVDDLLDEEIERLESRYNAIIPSLRATFRTAEETRKVQEQALNHPDLLHIRWIDLKAPARRALRSGHLAYLKALEDLIQEDSEELD